MPAVSLEPEEFGCHVRHLVWQQGQKLVSRGDLRKTSPSYESLADRNPIKAATEKDGAYWRKHGD